LNEIILESSSEYNYFNKVSKDEFVFELKKIGLSNDYINLLSEKFKPLQDKLK